ncbi:MAG: succinate dehydrogenase [Phycisphaerae bacterium]|nr:succinate dehydrogenase [Phycisphaerae bacterium]|tara:strand:+ start:4313 stop:5089 length:777 start_codon:yes stop_codon:yes gene_type:complete
MRLLRFYQSSVGKKVVVAVTGAIMIGFLLAHVWGNLHVYFGAEEINDYSVWLRTFLSEIFGYGGLLWVIRAIIGGALVLHVITIFLLIRQNRAARPVGYKKTSHRRRIVVGSTMALSGILILCFIVFHILQFTTGTIHPTTFHVDPSNGLGVVYINLYEAFQVWWIAGIYVGAMALIGIHIYHGAWSMFQSIGMNNQDRNGTFRAVAVVLSIGLFLGFASVPVLFWTDVLPPPAEHDIAVQMPIDESATAGGENDQWN